MNPSIGDGSLASVWAIHPGMWYEHPCTSPVLPWCVSLYTLGVCPMNVWNICTKIYTDIGCPGQRCRKVPPSTVVSCIVVVVRGNSKFKDLNGGRRLHEAFVRTKERAHLAQLVLC